MKTVTILIDFADGDAETVEALTQAVDLSTLLRDVLGEFVSTRTPAEKYVTARYVGVGERFRANKIREVAKRVKLAENLARGDVTIIVDQEVCAPRAAAIGVIRRGEP